MDYVAHMHRELVDFQAAVARAAEGGDGAPLVPSCPGWSVSDLMGHLGGVHRYVGRVVRDRLLEPPEPDDLRLYDLPDGLEGWPVPESAPNRGPVPPALLTWFAEGAETLVALLRERDPAQKAWTWSREQSVGFWRRMQAIEAAVHRWDAQCAVEAPAPLDAELAADAVTQTFEVMAPRRRVAREVPPGSGECYRFRRSDGPEVWTVRFEDDEVRLHTGPEETAPAPGAELSGTASELALFLWHRTPARRLTMTGDPSLFERYFTLVPPV
ncbi:maleylpyruvate isomerase family mycothiol-dependent enzyme [Streptomyces albiaxialis]|uniref:Maleylpyruvate isomerase family mycothiol-dependent enzyme n=1 Tax=Streptomyces albiaxialis TaxID=329523 RepID=A0ABN2W1H0_9ACTN